MDTNKVRSVIVKRACRLDFNTVYKMLDGLPFILAGGALGKEKPNDFDIYPAHGGSFDTKGGGGLCTLAAKSGYKVLSSTKNALTLRCGEQTIQFCNYSKPTLDELLSSFDFAHCQVGVMFNGQGQPPSEEDVSYTSDFETAMMCGDTFYTGSEYPLSSLVRTVKYVQKGKFLGRSYIVSVLDALSDVVKRGFRDYDDFKDQMDAIDLHLSDYEKAFDLFLAFDDAGLVEKSVSQPSVF